MKVLFVSVVVAVGILLLAHMVGRLPADCDDVAEQLTSFALGNYAELEDRAPVADGYRAVCRREGVTRDEGACIAMAKSRYAAARCAPRLFPDITVCEGSACMLARMKQFAAQMCACGPGDRPCADKVNEQMTTWGKEMASAHAGERSPPISPEDIEVMTKITTRLSECMTKAYTMQ